VSRELVDEHYKGHHIQSTARLDEKNEYRWIPEVIVSWMPGPRTRQQFEQIHVMRGFATEQHAEMEGMLLARKWIDDGKPVTETPVRSRTAAARYRIEACLALFKKSAFENAVRLFEDASLLFQSRRFPSALALAVTSFEELGKMHVIDRGCDVIDHGCDGICLNPDAFDDIYETYFMAPWLTDHLHKQRQALFDALDLMPDQEKTLSPWVNSGGLENERRIALYVEMTIDQSSPRTA
jgi:AbiV family abortive infection protein